MTHFLSKCLGYTLLLYCFRIFPHGSCVLWLKLSQYRSFFFHTCPLPRHIPFGLMYLEWSLSCKLLGCLCSWSKSNVKGEPKGVYGASACAGKNFDIACYPPQCTLCMSLVLLSEKKFSNEAWYHDIIKTCYWTWVEMRNCGLLWLSGSLEISNRFCYILCIESKKGDVNFRTFLALMDSKM